MFHTNLLAIAVPMAHCLAIKGLRYRFSHRQQHLPIWSLSKLLRGKYVTMHLSFQKGSEHVPWCAVLNYLPQPIRLEDMTLWDFWSKTKVATCKFAESRGEFYKFSQKINTHGLFAYKQVRTHSGLDLFWGRKKSTRKHTGRNLWTNCGS